MKRAVICIDFINEIIHPEGKLSGKGYLKFMQQHNSVEQIQSFLQYERELGSEIIHVKLAFLKDYSDHPSTSLLLWAAKNFGILQRDSWSTEFLSELWPEKNEKIFIKNRISAFYNTVLGEYLEAQSIKDITIIWVATDLAVESAVRDAHDRGFKVSVKSTCCIAANERDHENSIECMRKISEITD